MKRNFKRIISAAMSMLMIAGTFPAAAFGAVENGWEEVDGRKYWYESGVKQGTEGRGKEIYDPGSDAWYWLDSVDGGAMAYSKDLFQESSAGQWAGSFVEGDWKASTGKWVRYDENGHMIKGWYENENGRYYFDETYGTMAKGYAVIKNENGQYIEYYFDVTTGILLRELGETPEQGWKNVEGIDVWYENHIRQGYSIDESYRG
jgi:glucan-binding YG repeat protein